MTRSMVGVAVTSEPMGECTYPPDWRRLRNVRFCPNDVVGMSCVAANPTSQCICERYNRQLLDHRKAWVTEDEELAITAEPYEIAGELLAAFIGECEGLGLAVSITGASPHNPGSTILLKIRRRAAP